MGTVTSDLVAALLLGHVPATLSKALGEGFQGCSHLSVATPSDEEAIVWTSNLLLTGELVTYTAPLLHTTAGLTLAGLRTRCSCDRSRLCRSCTSLALHRPHATSPGCRWAFSFLSATAAVQDLKQVCSSSTSALVCLPIPALQGASPSVPPAVAGALLLAVRTSHDFDRGALTNLSSLASSLSEHLLALAASAAAWSRHASPCPTSPGLERSSSHPGQLSCSGSAQTAEQGTDAAPTPKRRRSCPQQQGVPACIALHASPQPLIFFSIRATPAAHPTAASSSSSAAASAACSAAAAPAPFTVRCQPAAASSHIVVAALTSHPDGFWHVVLGHEARHVQIAVASPAQMAAAPLQELTAAQADGLMEAAFPGTGALRSLFIADSASRGTLRREARRPVIACQGDDVVSAKSAAAVPARVKAVSGNGEPGLAAAQEAEVGADAGGAVGCDAPSLPDLRGMSDEDAVAAALDAWPDAASCAEQPPPVTAAAGDVQPTAWGGDEAAAPAASGAPRRPPINPWAVPADAAAAIAPRLAEPWQAETHHSLGAEAATVSATPPPSQPQPQPLRRSTSIDLEGLRALLAPLSLQVPVAADKQEDALISTSASHKSSTERLQPGTPRRSAEARGTAAAALCSHDSGSLWEAAALVSHEGQNQVSGGVAQQSWAVSRITLRYCDPELERKYGLWHARQQLKVDNYASLIMMGILAGVGIPPPLKLLWDTPVLFLGFALLTSSPLILRRCALSQARYLAHRESILAVGYIVLAAYTAFVVLPLIIPQVPGGLLTTWMWFSRMLFAEGLFICALLFMVRFHRFVPMQLLNLGLVAAKTSDLCAQISDISGMPGAACRQQAGMVQFVIGFVVPACILYVAEVHSRGVFAAHRRRATRAK